MDKSQPERSALALAFEKAQEKEADTATVTEAVQGETGRNVRNSLRKKASTTASVKNFRNGQNARGEFIANVLIDLADSDSEWWTGVYNHVILGMSKTDNTEFRQFYQEIMKRTKHMARYEESEEQPVTDSFTVGNGRGKEYVYRVELDGYLHGVVLSKTDKAKYAAMVRKEVKGGRNGKSASDIIRRAGNARSYMGGNNTGNGRSLPSGGDFGLGGVGGGSSRSKETGNDSRGKSPDQKVSDSAGLTEEEIPKEWYKQQQEEEDYATYQEELNRYLAGYDW